MTPAEIVARLRAVAADMESLGAAMDYFGGFNGRMAQHGREMVGRPESPASGPTR
jgi:hypothetical protein